MKTIFKKLATFCTFLALCLATGLSGAHAPNVTPDVNHTWRNSVTTAKAKVEFHGVSQQVRALSWFGFSLADGGRINKTAVLTNLALAGFIGSAVGFEMGSQFGLMITGAIFTLGTIVPILAGPPKQTLSSQGLAFTGVAQEVWAKDITERLFPESDFMWEAIDDNDKLIGKTVHLPQIGTQSRVVKNRNIFPATATPRVDTIADYDIDDFTTDPRLITMSEEEVLSYDKRRSIIEDDMMTLKIDTAANLLYAWNVKQATAANSVRSSGADRNAYGASQTGQRKAVVLADFIQLHRILNQQNVPNSDRCVLIDAGIYSDLLMIEQLTNQLYIGNTSAMQEGFIGKALGFKFYVSTMASTFSNDASPILNAVGAAGQATDNLSIMAWHPRFVRRAWGNLANGGLKIFDNPEQAIYYGSVLSLLVRCGGCQARATGEGIAVLVESAA